MSFVNGGTKGPKIEDDRRVFTEHPMEGEGLQTSSKFLRSDTKLALWIIEYVWAHNMTDILEVLDSSRWPEMDPLPLSLEDPLRLRVGSAQAYSIVRSRNSEHFEPVMEFLEATHRLVPRLVSPVKHMKIMFGLKTMLIMRMLKKSQGLVDTMFKINQLFPSKLPQYQDHCNQHHMFLMKKNHLDFKAFVQELALEKEKLEHYVENQMEDQYGELYAQKVEERLLHYLLRLEAVLPGETCADKILKKGSPMTEEEKMLLKVVTSDSVLIAKTLKKLLQCDVVSTCPGGVSESSESDTGRSPNAKSASQSSDLEPLFVPVEAKSGHPETDPDVLVDSCLMENDLKRPPPQTEWDGGVVRKGVEQNSHSGKAGISQSSGEDVQRAALSPQFCSKHQRWVNNILQECPAECSEELQLQANVSSSPPLFQSSSGSSSDDLTPSNLLPLLCNQQPPASHTPTHLQTSGQGHLEDKPELLSLRDTPQPGVLLPVVQLIDIASMDKFCAVFKRQQASPNCSQQAASASSPSSPRIPTSEDDFIHQETMKDSTSNRSEALVPENPLNSTHGVQSVIISQGESTSICRSTPQKHPSRVLKRSRPGSQTLGRVGVHQSAQTTFTSSCPLLQLRSNIPGPPQRDASTSAPQSKSLLTETPFQHGILQDSDPLPQPHSSTPSETSRVQRAQLKLSLCSQTMLLQSKLLQPRVSLVRLRETEAGSSTGDVGQGSSGDRRMEEEEDTDSSFDVNVLFSSSSDGESEDSLLSDPLYKPSIKRKRLLMEYEAARSMNNI
ncbi:uncharacterized protein LOC141796625 [Halichoeres trimaculatus]|uniref:uncharacterized protein LOC141796625 n=1 Tax=Halichoeres trimaculatus TaxID=147232 RepID=UPI003D9F253C